MVPKIRFKGAYNDKGEWVEFINSWEQRKLGEVGSCQSGIGFPDIEQGGTEGIPFFKVSDMNIKGNEYELLQSNNYVTQEQIERKKWKPITEVPAMFFAKVGAAVMLNRKRLVNKPFLLDNNTMAYKFSDEWNTNFGKTLFDTINLTSLVQVGAIPSYNTSDVENIEIALPTIAEQQKIGYYFYNIDTLVTLSEQKLESYQKLKKCMLQKMFPKDGSNVPEIRFKGAYNDKGEWVEFTDPWEQRELKELASFAKGSGYSKTDIKVEGTPIILYGRLYTKYETTINDVDTFAEAKKGSIYSKGSEVIVPASGETSEDIARASFVSKPGILLGGDLNIIYPNSAIEPTFLALSISNGEQQKSLAKKAQGKSVVHLHNSDLETVQITYPTRQEQTKIGQYFESIDHLITLHQRKLDLYQKFKKAMLQQMFV